MVSSEESRGHVEGEELEGSEAGARAVGIDATFSCSKVRQLVECTVCCCAIGFQTHIDVADLWREKSKYEKSGSEHVDRFSFICNKQLSRCMSSLCQDTALMQREVDPRKQSISH